MNISTVKNVVVKGFGRGLLQAKKHSPVILTSVGVVGVISAAVLSSKATLGLEAILDETREHKEIAEMVREKDDLSDSDHTKNLTYIQTKSVMRIVKLYAPAVTLGLGSIACLISAQGIMHKRNVALAAAYKAVEQGFSEYRKRVVADLGLDKDFEYRYGDIVTKEVVDEGTGDKKVISTFGENVKSIYARFFDEYNINWSKRDNQNLLYVRCQQQYANDLLLSRGHLFLNEVYDMLGMERSSEGSIVGWLVSKGGDNYVDFGIYDIDSEAARQFVNGKERSILLDFNVDGVIFDKI